MALGWQMLPLIESCATGFSFRKACLYRYSGPMSKQPLHQTTLETLPNLGKTTVLWLRAIGIRDVASLRDRGIFWAFERMQSRGFRVTTAVLFSLEGALQDRPWRSFSAAEKDALLKKLARSIKRPDTDARPVPQAAARHTSQRHTSQRHTSQRHTSEENG